MKSVHRHSSTHSSPRRHMAPAHQTAPVEQFQENDNIIGHSACLVAVRGPRQDTKPKVKAENDFT
jgi:hypothetical protein